MIYRRKIINSGICVFFLIIILFVLTIPSFREINRINRIIISQKTYLEKLYLQGQLLKKVKQQLLDVKPLINQLSDKFVQSGHDIQFITQLEGLAKNNKIQQNISFKTEQKGDKGFYQIIPIQLYLKGDFRNLMYYLRDLQEATYYLTIDSINIADSTEETLRLAEGINQTTTNIDLTITGQSYWINNK